MTGCPGKLVGMSFGGSLFALSMPAVGRCSTAGGRLEDVVRSARRGV